MPSLRMWYCLDQILRFRGSTKAQTRGALLKKCLTSQHATQRTYSRSSLTAEAQLVCALFIVCVMLKAAHGLWIQGEPPSC